MSKAILLTVEVSASSVLFMAHARHVHGTWKLADTKLVDAVLVLNTQSIWVCLKMLCTPTPNGFADHYPY